MFSVYAHRVAAVKDEENGAVKKVTDSVENYNSENRFERTIIVANDNKTAILLILRLKQDGVKTSVFTNYLADDEIVLGEQKKAFVEGAHKVAVCTTQMFEKMEFDVVKHYIFVDAPAEEKLRDQLRQKAVCEGKKIRVDLVMSESYEVSVKVEEKPAEASKPSPKRKCSFDIYSIKPNKQGKFVIPAEYMGFDESAEDDEYDSEYDDDDYNPFKWLGF